MAKALGVAVIDFLTPQELAKILKVSKACVSKWKQQGLLPYYEFGGCVRFSKTEIEQWISECYHPGPLTTHQVTRVKE